MPQRLPFTFRRTSVVKFFTPWLLASSTLIPSLAYADANAQRLAESLSVNGHSMPVAQVTATAMDGLYHVRLETGESFYSNVDGSYFLLGDLYQNTEGGLVNLTEQARNQERLVALAAVPDNERVIFQGMGTPKATVVVFTDPSCPYCVRLHEVVPELNEMGIAVHYMAFPRAGVGSAAADTMRQVWCADNRTEAMNQAKRGETLTGTKSCEEPIAEQHELGLRIGVQGTPAIILPDGQLVPGFVPPERLASMLGLDE